MKEAGLSLFDRVLGGCLGLLKGTLFVAVILVGMTAFTPTVEVAGRFAISAVFPGGRPGRDLDCPIASCGQVLSGAGPASSRACAGAVQPALMASRARQ